MSNCPVAPFSWEAIGVVNDAHNTLMPLGVTTFNAATSMAEGLAAFAMTPVDVNVIFDDVNPPGGIQRPARPNFPESGLVLRKPGGPPDPPGFAGGISGLVDPPVFTRDPPEPNFGERPGDLDATKPGTPPKPPERTAPPEPKYTLPPVPVLDLLNIPPAPVLQNLQFTATPPGDSDLPAIVENWSFTPQQYTSALLDKIKATIDWGLDGGIGLPAAIQDALWARARGRVDIEEARAIQQTVDEFGTRGFTEPNGILNQRLEIARQNNQNQRLALSRDLVIEEAKLEIENLRFMVQQGVALEGTLIQLHLESQRLNLQAAQFLLDSAIRVFEVKASLIRLRYDIYVAQAQVFKTRVEAELARVEIFKAQIEAEKARGEVNEQRVRQYEAQIKAVQALAEFYNSRVRAFVALVEGDNAVLAGFAQKVNAYRAEVDAKVAEWNGYSARVQGESAKVGAYDSLVRAYGARVSAVSEQNRVTLDRERLEIQQHEAQLRTHTALLENIRTELAAEQARVQSVAAAFGAQAQVFAADAQVEQAVSAALDRRYGLDIQKSSAAAQVATQNGQMQVQQNVQLTSIQLQALQAATATLTQLAASALSAVNYSAGIGYQQSGSVSCGTTHNYQY